jgi:hypothetical protein
MAEDNKDVVDSGFTRQQGYYALKKAKMGYHISYKENNPQGKKYYAWILYKLHRELGIPLVPLPEEKMLVLEFLLKNRGLFKQQGSLGIKHAEVLKFMMESGYMPDKPIRIKKIKVKNRSEPEYFYMEFDYYLLGPILKRI